MPNKSEFIKKALERDENTIRDMFSQAAPRYDFLNHLLSFNLDKSWRRKLMALSCFHKYGEDVKILDLCTGTGDVIFNFLKNPSFKGQAVGLDFSPQMLSIARNKASKLGFEKRVDFIEGNALQTPFPDNSFHIVTIAWGLRNLSDLQKGLNEIYRLLKPAGRFLSLEFFRHDDGFSKTITSFYTKFVIPVIGGMLSSSQAYRYLSESREKFLSAQEFTELLKSCGFINISHKHFIFQINTLHIGEKPE